MGVKYKHTFGTIVSPLNFDLAYQRTCKGKRSTRAYKRFEDDRIVNLMNLRKSVEDLSFEPLPPRKFTIFEPKPRNISAPQFRDRIVQHAIHGVLNPIFDKTFLSNSYACRTGYGTHLCAKETQRLAKLYQNGFYLKTDFKKYFHSINRAIVWTAITAKITCKRTLSLLEKLVPKTGIGINIGELMSQLLANINGNFVDMFLKHILKVKHFLRYMDDLVIFGYNRAELINIKNQLQEYCSTKLGLAFSKWFVKPVKQGINFVGYIIYPYFKLLRKSSINRAKRKLKVLSGNNRNKFLVSWLGHISHANCYNLKLKLGVA